jgi:hypothetical protein
LSLSPNLTLPLTCPSEATYHRAIGALNWVLASEDQEKFMLKKFALIPAAVLLSVIAFAGDQIYSTVTLSANGSTYATAVPQQALLLDINVDGTWYNLFWSFSLHKYVDDKGNWAEFDDTKKEFESHLGGVDKTGTFS